MFGWWNRRRDAGLIEKHLDEAVFGREVTVHHLDGHEAMKPAAADRAREVDRRHAAGADLGDYIELADPYADEVVQGSGIRGLHPCV